MIRSTRNYTLTMSMGWITHVASMPEAPPLTKGLMVVQTPDWVLSFASAIAAPKEWEVEEGEEEEDEGAEKLEKGRSEGFGRGGGGERGYGNLNLGRNPRKAHRR